MNVNQAGILLKNEYQIFIDYLLNNPIIFTRKQKLGRKICFDLNKHLTSYQETFDKPSYDQDKYGIIDFFSFITINHYVVEIKCINAKKFKIEKEIIMMHYFLYLLSSSILCF